jgi:cytochrome c-type biogenesis protein CcmF
VAVAIVVAGVTSIAAIGAVSLAAAVLATCAVEFGRAITRGRKQHGWQGAFAPLAQKRRRYGAYLAHAGFAVLVIGLAASNFWQQEKNLTLQPGQQASVAGFTLTYSGSEQRRLADHSELVGLVRFGDQTLQPARATYAGLGGQALTHVAISTTAVADVYVILAGTNPDGSASFRILVNPLVSWIWAGGFVIIFGVVLGNAGSRKAAPVPALVPARQGAA